MEDLDILKLQKILRYKGRDDLSQLLAYSTSYLDQSGSFGSRWYSVMSTFEIKSPPSLQDKIDKLPKEDKDEIFSALLLIYPLRDNSPEITQVLYYPDFDLESFSLVETKELERISFEYIHQQIKKCNDKIAEKDFDGAVTNARTLIESVCLYILESKLKEKHVYDGNLLKLYKTVATILRMSPGDYDDDNLKQILSGVFSIINGVSGLRNKYSDSHGSSPSNVNYKIDDRHAILTVNLAKTITEYLFLCFEKGDKPNIA